MKAVRRKPSGKSPLGGQRRNRTARAVPLLFEAFSGFPKFFQIASGISAARS
jgi:hypothetical protein